MKQFRPLVHRRTLYRSNLGLVELVSASHDAYLPPVVVPDIRVAVLCAGIAERLPGRGACQDVLHEKFARPASLIEVAEAVGVSPVYLTQAFRAREGLPLYRYQTRLRMGRP